MTDYKLLEEQIRGLAEISGDMVSLMSNASALLYEALADVNWAGFYIVKNGADKNSKNLNRQSSEKPNNALSETTSNEPSENSNNGLSENPNNEPSENSPVQSISLEPVLLVGPFQGKVACVRIEKGRGVCGTAWAEDRTQLVPDVHKFPGHIACDSVSNSEIVIPIHHDGEVVAVLDIDSPLMDRFTEEDKIGLEKFVGSLEDCIDFV